MYLKNRSDRMSIVINTVSGKIGMKPKEIINLNVKLLPPIPSNLVEVTEHDYLTFQEAKNGTMETIIESQTLANEIHDVPDKKMGETVVTNPITQEQTVTPDDITDQIKDDGIMDFVKTLFKSGMLDEPQNPQDMQTIIQDQPETPTEEAVVVADETPADALVVEDTNDQTELEKLESKLDELTKTWLETKAARKKEKLQKQIKELQKQINKLKP